MKYSMFVSVETDDAEVNSDSFIGPIQLSRDLCRRLNTRSGVYLDIDNAVVTEGTATCVRDLMTELELANAAVPDGYQTQVSTLADRIKLMAEGLVVMQKELEALRVHGSGA